VLPSGQASVKDQEPEGQESASFLRGAPVRARDPVLVKDQASVKGQKRAGQELVSFLPDSARALERGQTSRAAALHFCRVWAIDLAVAPTGRVNFRRVTH